MEKVEREMELLVKLVVDDSSKGISKAIKQTFLVVAKTFCHMAYFSTYQIDKHIEMVLIKKVM